MDSERERASKLGLRDPICATLDTTHKTYYKALETIFHDPKKQVKGILIGSHNQETLERAMSYPRDGIQVMFGQLMGMSDHLTLALATNGHLAYKYIPVGTLHQVLPYLLRRAKENSGLVGRVAMERKQMDQVLKYRLASTFKAK
jgi:proline dehydrogenase